MNPYLYQPKNTIAHRLDPRTKILMLLAGFVIALVPKTLPHALGVLALVAVCVTVARCWDAVARIRTFLFIITVFTIVIWGLVPRGGETLWLFIKRESLVFGVLTAIKIDAILMMGIIFLATTRNEEVTVGLVKMGVPYVMCFAFSTALRLVPTFAHTGATVVEAQRSRGLDFGTGSLWSRMKAYIPLMTPIFLVSIRNANLMAMALEARGFGSSKKRTFYIQLKMHPHDWIALVVTAVLSFASLWFAT
ncbi:MAG: energy-coupling factor transporter transmembrane protein EcfT [Candidatus Abyssobacteria bacterium SURF_17]|uniref:Energy-coupling factor transporter transmembrane protein EcfT n=1 Tax=Candidatus Abyssobacteria bacterium SURF_17 TaxID=2093361 RepID=A0A419F2H4_9BACT|nr:MAG: energy-coupling factor transporter transmembrane protein EcfT [Candidatus Abyssubacteria bacterium SURF_17]